MCRKRSSSSMIRTRIGAVPLVLDGGCGPLGDRQREGERGTMARLRLHRQLSAMGLDDPLRNGQAQTGAASLCIGDLDEWAEDAREVLARDTAPGVAHRERDEACNAAFGYRNRSASWRGCHSIGQQV